MREILRPFPALAMLMVSLGACSAAEQPAASDSIESSNTGFRYVYTVIPYAAFTRDHFDREVEVGVSYSFSARIRPEGEGYLLGSDDDFFLFLERQEGDLRQCLEEAVSIGGAWFRGVYTGEYKLGILDSVELGDLDGEACYSDGARDTLTRNLAAGHDEE